MMNRIARAISMAGIVAGCTLLLGSCALLLPQRPERGVTRVPSDTPRRHIAQTGFGSGARFGVCTEPDCPAVTQKTLAIAADDRTAASSQDAGAGVAPVLDAEKQIISLPSTESAAKPADHAAVRATVHATTRDHHVTVQFKSGSDSLTGSGKDALDRSLRLALKASRIVIHGRTDSVGSDAPNQALAFARALSVRDYLREREPTIPADMVLDAKGHCCFIASNDTPQGRQQNRRVEIVFSVPERVAP
jgi:outer membrane protein OmpA-like peptidoglycan-associated protein